MTRTAVFVTALVLMASAAGAGPMTPTAPDHMASPADKLKMKACQDRAAAAHVLMADRSRFVMDCMAKRAN